MGRREWLEVETLLGRAAGKARLLEEAELYCDTQAWRAMFDALEELVEKIGQSALEAHGEDPAHRALLQLVAVDARSAIFGALLDACFEADCGRLGQAAQALEQAVLQARLLARPAQRSAYR